MEYKTLDELREMDVDSMSREEFGKFLQQVQIAKQVASRVSVEELEREFMLKNYILSDSEWGTELFTGEFVDTLFGRSYLKDVEVLPYEDAQSYEYNLWLNKKKEHKGRVENGEIDELHPIDYSGYRMWRYNPIIFYKNNKGKPAHRIYLNDDGESEEFLQGRKFAIMSPVTYVGRNNTYKNARYLYAIGIDLDGLGERELHWLLNGTKNGFYPKANIIVNSGHGVHVYFLLKEPIEMYDTRLPMLNKLKARLTKLIWAVSQYDTIQIQSVVQGFRVPGTLTKFGATVRAFWNRNAPLHTIDSLNGFMTDLALSKDELNQIRNTNVYNPTKVTIDEAKNLWPEWYVARIVNGKRSAKPWKVDKGLYNWWLAKLRKGDNVENHHRYWCVFTLVVFAVKCGIPREQVLEDALALVPSFDMKTETVDNPFIEEDVLDAMRAYDVNYNKWPASVIEATTGIRIERCRRNGRNQKTHLRRCRSLQEVDYPNGAWREGNGRKKGSVKEASESRCAAIVKAWRDNHPENQNKSLCARETGLDRKTVRKWWG